MDLEKIIPTFAEDFRNNSAPVLEFMKNLGLALKKLAENFQSYGVRRCYGINQHYLVSPAPVTGCFHGNNFYIHINGISLYVSPSLDQSGHVKVSKVLGSETIKFDEPMTLEHLEKHVTDLIRADLSEIEKRMIGEGRSREMRALRNLGSLEGFNPDQLS